MKSTFNSINDIWPWLNKKLKNSKISVIFGLTRSKQGILYVDEWRISLKIYTGCYNVNVTFIPSPRDGILEFVNFEFWHVFIFPAFEKKTVKFFKKLP